MISSRKVSSRKVNFFGEVKTNASAYADTCTGITAFVHEIARNVDFDDMERTVSEIAEFIARSEDAREDAREVLSWGNDPGKLKFIKNINWNGKVEYQLCWGVSPHLQVIATYNDRGERIFSDHDSPILIFRKNRQSPVFCECYEKNNRRLGDLNLYFFA